MRGDDPRHEAMFSYITPEARVRPDHPLRPIRQMTDAALARLSRRFDRLYSTTGRPSIPPEQLLRALLLQMLYSIRSERLLMEELDYSVLYRWFVGLSLDDPIWDATTFTKNRDRLLDGEIAEAFFAQVVAAIKREGLLSDEHFTVDGTVLEAWASHKSFKPKGTPRPPDAPKNPDVSFHGQTRRNDTHQSTTDPDARLCKKAGGHEAKLAYLGHLLTENRHGLIVSATVTRASGTAEREATIRMLRDLPTTTQRRTVGADKLYDTRGWVAAVRALGITPHVAQYVRPRGGSAIDARTTRHPGYAVSQRKRKLIEQVFGWMKTVGLFRKLRHRGCRRVAWMFTFGAAAYNLVRWRNLVAQPA